MKFSTIQLFTLLSTLTTPLLAYPTTQTLAPENISLYHGFNGRIEYAVPRGKTSRLPSSNDDISTLITFSFPESTRGRKCEFNFELNDANTYVLDATFIDVFTSSKIATGNSAAWGPPGNSRDQQLGRLRLVKAGQASAEWGNFVFDCPAGEKRGFEVTPTGDRGVVEWQGGVDGPFIRWF